MKKKVMSMLLVLTMAAGLFAGCGSDPADTPDAGNGESGGSTQSADAGTPAPAPAESTDDGDVYTVDMYLLTPAEVPQGLDRVLEEVNKITLAELNMKLNVVFLSFATGSQQIPLMLSSGEKFDINFGGSANAPNYVNSGYLTNLADLLPAVEDTLNASYGTDEMEYASVNGYIYGVPMHKDQVFQTTVFFATDILEKHGLMDEALAITSIEELDVFFEKVSALEPDMWMTAPEIGVNGGRMKTILYDGLGDMWGVLMDLENGTTIENLFETEEFYEYCRYMHKWYQNGWVSQSAATDTESYYTYIKTGQAFSFFSDFSHPLSESDQEANCGGKDLTMITIGPKYQTTETAFQFTYSIPSSSEDPEKVMQMINFMANSPEINNLLNWGIEGEDYIVTEDGHAAFPEGKDADSVAYHLDGGWTLPNQYLCYPWEGKDIDVYDQMKAYNTENVTQSVALGLQWDSANVSNELAAVTNVRDKYYKEITSGTVDPDEYIPLFNEELYAAGLDKIMAEKQRQLDEFLAGK